MFGNYIADKVNIQKDKDIYHTIPATKDPNKPRHFSKEFMQTANRYKKR